MARRTSVASEQALQQLASLTMKVDAIDAEASTINEKLTSHTASEEEALEYQGRIAQLNGALEKLQFQGIDGGDRTQTYWPILL
jgi:hypothetical protein